MTSPIKKTLLKLLFAFCVAIISFFITAGGCDEGNWAYLNEDAVLEVTTEKDYVKIEEKQRIIINAEKLAQATTSPISSADYTKNGGIIGAIGLKTVRIFSLHYPGNKTALFTIVRDEKPRVGIDKIAFRAVDTCVQGGTGTDAVGSEASEHAVATAAQGGVCRRMSTDGTRMFFDSYLGTVFDTEKKDQARGNIICKSTLNMQINPC